MQRALTFGDKLASTLSLNDLASKAKPGVEDMEKGFTRPLVLFAALYMQIWIGLMGEAVESEECV